MRNNRGFSLIEMQVSFVVATILILAVGAISSISTQSYNKIRNEATLYDDLSYGFMLVQNRVRKSDSPVEPPESMTDSRWVTGKRLVVDNAAFGLFKETGQSKTEFIYLPDKDDLSTKEIIFEVEDTDEIDLILATTVSGVTLTLEGEKNEVPFDITTQIVRRVQ